MGESSLPGTWVRSFSTRRLSRFRSLGRRLEHACLSFPVDRSLCGGGARWTRQQRCRFVTGAPQSAHCRCCCGTTSPFVLAPPDSGVRCRSKLVSSSDPSLAAVVAAAREEKKREERAPDFEPCVDLPPSRAACKFAAWRALPDRLSALSSALFLVARGDRFLAYAFTAGRRYGPSVTHW